MGTFQNLVLFCKVDTRVIITVSFLVICKLSSED